MTSEVQVVTDEALARQTQAGSLAAFEQLVYRYEKRIYGFVAHSCHQPADARELTQDIFVRAFQAIGQFQDRHGFAPWLFAIARNKCIDSHRLNRPRLEELSPELAAGDNPAELVAREDEHQDLWRLAQRRLPDIQFQALWFRYAEELDLPAVARALGKTQTHTKVLLFRARRALGRELERHGRPRPGMNPEPTSNPTQVRQGPLKHLRLPAV